MDWGTQKGPESSGPGPCVNPEGFALRGFDGLHLIARVRDGLRQEGGLLGDCSRIRG